MARIRLMGTASPASAEAVLGRLRTPEECGAVGDGSRDDTAALQAAIDAVREEVVGTAELRHDAVHLVSSVDIQHGLTLEGTGARIDIVCGDDGRAVITDSAFRYLGDPRRGADPADLLLRRLRE